MEMRRLGASGPLVSAIGLGCNNLSRPQTASASLEGSIAVVHAALDAGVTFFDSADIYGAAVGTGEEYLGLALAGHRDEVVLATKFGHWAVDAYPCLDLGPKGGERYIRHAVEQSLRRLRTDRIDLYQLHTPDPATLIAETLGVLADLVDEGKVLHLGYTQCSPDQVKDAADAARASGRAGFVSVQQEYSLLHRGATSPRESERAAQTTPAPVQVERDLLPVVAARGLGFLPFLPLAHGLLTGKYTASTGEGRLRTLRPELLEGVDWAQLDAYRVVCDEAGTTMLEASLGWLLAQTSVSSVIAGATTPEQVRANARATSLDADLAARVGDVFAQP